MTGGIYEQLKDDLGYVQLARAAETFATLAETARQQDWTHLQFLARLIGDQATATRDLRMAARLRYARFPFRRTIDEFDYDLIHSAVRALRWTRLPGSAGSRSRRCHRLWTILAELRTRTYTAFRTALGVDGTKLPSDYGEVIDAVTTFADPLAGPTCDGMRRAADGSRRRSQQRSHW